MFQLKYDGWWSRTEIVGGSAQVFTQSGRHLPQFDFQTKPELDGTYIGELMFGTNWSQAEHRQGKVFLFDVWRVRNTDMEQLPYKDRLAVARALQPFLPVHYLRVMNFAITEFPSIWDKYVDRGDFEGVVFRRMKDGAGATIMRHKKTVNETYICKGYQEGKGKYLGTLGALIYARLEDPERVVYVDSGEPATVGGGFTDEQRRHIWDNREDYLNKPFEVEGKARFEATGLLRHPNFVRWKE